MIKSLDLIDLTAQKKTFLEAIDELEKSTDVEKILSANLLSTAGKVPDALELVEAIDHSSADIQVETNCKGELSPAGAILAASGKPKFRKANYSTMFRLREDLKDEKNKTIQDPYETLTVATLCTHKGRKAKLVNIMKTQSVISAFDAKSCGLIDNAGIPESKYK